MKNSSFGICPKVSRTVFVYIICITNAINNDQSIDNKKCVHWIQKLLLYLCHKILDGHTRENLNASLPLKVKNKNCQILSAMKRTDIYFSWYPFRQNEETRDNGGSNLSHRHRYMHIKFDLLTLVWKTKSQNFLIYW